MTAPANAPATRDLAAILGEMDADAATYERHGDTARAAALRERATEIREACAEFLQWLTEQEAELRSGQSRVAVRRLALAHLASGHARMEHRRYYLRACIVPVRGGR